jgi:CRISPR/Cas system-associated exonuclease Cas4 (RecB family)
MIGFELVRNQERFRWDEYKISGKTDGLAPLNRELPPPFTGLRDIPAEIKFMNQQAFDKIQTVDDFRNARGWWLRKYPSQLNSYMLMASRPCGYLIIGTAQRRPKVLPMLIDYELGEADLQMAQSVNRHIADGTTPEPIPFDAQVCEMCDFNHICQPLRASSSTIEIDPAEAIHLETFLESQKEYENAKKDYERRKALLIGNAKKPGKYYGHTALIGDIEISSKTIHRKGYAVEETEYTQTTIERVGAA